MLATILSLLQTFGKPLAALLAGFAAYGKGRADAKANAERKDMQAKLETRKRADEAEIVDGNPDSAARWLRERGKRDRRL